MFQQNKSLLNLNGTNDRRLAEMALAWLGYTAFGLLFLYVFTVMIAQNLNYGQIIFIAAFLALCFLGWKYCRQWIGGVLDHVQLSHIIMLAAAIRLAWVLSSGVEQTSDFVGYDGYALQIVKRGVFLSVIWAPGASIFFAIQYWIFGHIPLIPQISLALLSTLQIYLVYDITGRTLADKKAGKIAAIVLALWPEHIVYNNVLCTEVPFTTLVLLSIWLLWPDKRGYIWRVLLAGICLGAAHWVRPTAPIFLTAVLALLFLRRQGPISIWHRSRIALVGLAGFGVMLAILIYYNYHDIGIMSANPNKRSGYNLLFGTNLASQGFYNEPDIQLVSDEGMRRGIPPGQNSYYARDRAAYLAYDRIAREIGLGRIQQQPWKILRMAIIHKIPAMWGFPAGMIWSFETSRFNEYYYTFFRAALIYHIIIVGLCGWVVLRHRKYFAVMDERWIYVAALLLAVLSHIVLEIQPRYHHPFLPIFAMCIGAYARRLQTSQAADIEIYPSPEHKESAPDMQQRAA